MEISRNSEGLKEQEKSQRRLLMNLFDVPCQKKQIYMLKIDISHIDHSQWTHCVIKKWKFER